MDSSNVLALLEQLDDEIDDLEGSVAPLLETNLSEVASKLPLLDKAKLYVLVTYAVESILFSYLRLNGVKAREHPVFTELTRVKQYFNKIQVAETPVAKRENLRIDKTAAARFIHAGLAGNDKYGLQKAEEQAKERARSHIKFDELSKKRKVDQLNELQPEATTTNRSSASTSDFVTESSLEVNGESPIASRVSKEGGKADTSAAGSDSSGNLAISSSSEKSRHKRDRTSEGARKNKKHKELN